MQRHHNGSGRRTVITEDWSAHHRPILAGTRTATVTLRRPGGTPGSFDPVTGTTPVTPFPPYFGSLSDEPNARIQVLPANDQVRLAGQQEVSTLGYQVTLDHEVDGIQLEDILMVVAVDDNGDADLVDRGLIVQSIERGSLHWERRLLCTDNLETQEA